MPTRLLLVAFLAPAIRAATIVPVPDGNVTIGTIIANVDSAGDQTATFTLFTSHRSLMSDALGTQFRFFQVIYYDDEPVTWNGSIITAASSPAHTGTLVDSPSGGWDYELPAGDDSLPFYESDTGINPLTSEPFAFPTLSYLALHTIDGADPGISAAEDSPSLGQASHQTLFETYLAYLDPTLRAAQQFDLLAGFSWGIQTDSGAVQSGIAPLPILFSSIDAAKIAQLQGALDRSGFETWTVQTAPSFGLISTPEPATVLLVLCGAALLGGRRASARRAGWKAGCRAEALPHLTE